MEFAHVYPVKKTNLQDTEGSVYLGFLREYGNMRGIIEGYEHAIENILYIMKTRRYIIGKPDNDTLFGICKNPYVVTPTKTPAQILEQGNESYTLSIFSDVVLERQSIPSVTLKNVYWGEIPVALRSKYDPWNGTDIEMRNVARDPDEPHGTFITNGRKRTFNEQENLCSGSILVYYKDLKLDPKTLISSLTTESHFGLTAMYSLYFGGGRVLRFDNFRGWSNGMKLESMDVLDAFTLLGYDEDSGPLADFIAQFTRLEWRDKIKSAISPSLVAYYNHRIVPTELDSNNVLIPDPLISPVKRIKNEDYKFFTRERYEIQLRDELYSHIVNNPPGLRIKMAALARQIVRLVEVDLGLLLHDDRNSYKNKRFKGPGPAILHLFNLSMDEIWKEFYNKYGATLPADKLLILLQQRSITADFEHAFEKSWSTKGRPSMKATNYVEPLKDNQFILQHTHVTKIMRARDANSKNFPIRAVQSSQPPFVDMSETPENKNVGLSNVKSSGSYISQHNDINKLITTIERITIDKHNAVDWCVFKRDAIRNTIFVANGIVQGRCDGKRLRNHLIVLRRFGKIPSDTEIVYDDIDEYLYIKCDACRPLIPLFVVEHNSDKEPYIVAESKGLSIERFARNDISIKDWKHAGVIDLVDPTEADREYTCLGLKKMKELITNLREIRSKKSALLTHRNAQPFQALYVSKDDEFIVLTLEEHQSQIAAKLQTLNRIFSYSIKLRDKITAQILELESNKEQLSYNDQLDALSGEYERSHAKVVRYAGRVRVLTKEYEQTKPLIVSDFDVMLQRITHNENIAVKTCNFTYCLPDSMMIVGITSSLLPFHNHNPGPRQTFACKMIKQSMILPSHSQRWCPVPCKYTVMNARGPVETITYEYLGLDTHPAGVPVQLIMYVGQDTVEDMITMSRSFAESGATISVTSKIITKKIPSIGLREIKGNATVTMHVTNQLPKELIKRKRPGVFDNLSEDGIVIPGSVLRDGDCVIGAYLETIKPDSPTEYTDASRYVKKNKTGTVKDITMVKNLDGGMVVHIHINESSIAERGDKWANPHAQKATIGEILEQWEMPQSMRDGSTPDIATNSHCVPSRMTVGFLKEILNGRAHSLTGERFDGTPSHDSISVSDAGDILEKYKWQRTGKELYYFPKTGKILLFEVYSGFCHYYPLEHKAQPKLQNRYNGKSNARTHQSITGIENDGGQREGHMEHDVMRTHGASDTIMQWATRAADYYIIYTCAVCDSQVYPERQNGPTTFTCKECQRSIKKVHYAVSNVGYECLRKYSMVMGFNLLYILRPKVSLYLPNLTDTSNHSRATSIVAPTSLRT